MQQRNKRQRAAARQREEPAFVRSAAAVMSDAEGKVAGGSPVPSKGTAQPDASIEIIVSDVSAETDREGIYLGRPLILSC